MNRKLSQASPSIASSPMIVAIALACAVAHRFVDSGVIAGAGRELDGERLRS